MAWSEWFLPAISAQLGADGRCLTHACLPNSWAALCTGYFPAGVLRVTYVIF